MKPMVVNSTTLATVAYDAGRELLQLEFCDGAIYQYLGVSTQIHEALMRAPSKGSYFNRVIRGRFDFAPRKSLSLS
jgi:hypothetical protein